MLQPENPEHRLHWYALVATALIGLMIAVATLAPAGTLPSVPGTDKYHHPLAFAALTFPTAFLRPRLLFWVFPIAVAYGGLIEVLQPHFGRQREFADVTADAIGALMGVAIGLSLRLWILKTANPIRILNRRRSGSAN
ncbi:VanZ family protein [Aliiruegeria lutimaris]|uniref:VanZ family protein n=1 Tax=Aliiruegeria lutimaris TaxID=571298 RepID=UPI001113B6A4|nr:VanZ family protein [Aliiruegeria lutimaris]